MNSFKNKEKLIKVHINYGDCFIKSALSIDNIVCSTTVNFLPIFLKTKNQIFYDYPSYPLYLIPQRTITFKGIQQIPHTLGS